MESYVTLQHIEEIVKSFPQLLHTNESNFRSVLNSKILPSINNMILKAVLKSINNKEDLKSILEELLTNKLNEWNKKILDDEKQHKENFTNLTKGKLKVDDLTKEIVKKKFSKFVEQFYEKSNELIKVSFLFLEQFYEKSKEGEKSFKKKSSKKKKKNKKDSKDEPTVNEQPLSSAKNENTNNDTNNDGLRSFTNCKNIIDLLKKIFSKGELFFKISKNLPFKKNHEHFLNLYSPLSFVQLSKKLFQIKKDELIQLINKNKNKNQNNNNNEIKDGKLWFFYRSKIENDKMFSYNEKEKFLLLIGKYDKSSIFLKNFIDFYVTNKKSNKANKLWKSRIKLVAKKRIDNGNGRSGSGDRELGSLLVSYLIFLRNNKFNITVNEIKILLNLISDDNSTGKFTFLKEALNCFPDNEEIINQYWMTFVRMITAGEVDKLSMKVIRKAVEDLGKGQAEKVLCILVEQLLKGYNKLNHENIKLKRGVVLLKEKGLMDKKRIDRLESKFASLEFMQSIQQKEILKRQKERLVEKRKGIKETKRKKPLVIPTVDPFADKEVENYIKEEQIEKTYKENKKLLKVPNLKSNDNKSQSRSVFVGNIAVTVSEKQIRDLFSKCGKIESVSYRKRTYAFVNFESNFEALRALDKRGDVLNGKKITVNLQPLKNVPKNKLSENVDNILSKDVENAIDIIAVEKEITKETRKKETKKKDGDIDLYAPLFDDDYDDYERKSPKKQERKQKLKPKPSIVKKKIVKDGKISLSERSRKKVRDERKPRSTPSGSRITEKKIVKKESTPKKESTEVQSKALVRNVKKKIQKKDSVSKVPKEKYTPVLPIEDKITVKEKKRSLKSKSTTEDEELKKSNKKVEDSFDEYYKKMSQISSGKSQANKVTIVKSEKLQVKRKTYSASQFSSLKVEKKFSELPVNLGLGRGGSLGGPSSEVVRGRGGFRGRGEFRGRGREFRGRGREFRGRGREFRGRGFRGGFRGRGFRGRGRGRFRGRGRGRGRGRNPRFISDKSEDELLEENEALRLFAEYSKANPTTIDEDKYYDPYKDEGKKPKPIGEQEVEKKVNTGKYDSDDEDDYYSSRTEVKAKPKWNEKDQYTVFVVNIPSSVRDYELLNLFKKCGEVKSLDFKRPVGSDAGYAYVHFKHFESLEQAIKNCKFWKLRSKEFHCAFHDTEKEKVEVSSFLYYKNFPRTFTKEKVKEAFERQSGKNSVKKITFNNGNGKVEFQKSEQAKRALALDKATIIKNTVYVFQISEDDDTYIKELFSIIVTGLSGNLMNNLGLLKAKFKDCGMIFSMKLNMNPRDLACVINLQTTVGVETALRKHGKLLKGKVFSNLKLRVNRYTDTLYKRYFRNTVHGKR